MVDQYTYNNMNEPTKETETGPGNTPIAQYHYTYRKDGLTATETDYFWFAKQWPECRGHKQYSSYSYDALDRLTDEAFVTMQRDPGLLRHICPATCGNGQASTTSTRYDLDSNPVQKTTEFGSDTTVDETVTSTYNADDQLLEQVDTTTGGPGTPGSVTTQYTYNDTEQTSEAATSGTPSSRGTVQSSQEYQYDLQGQMSGATGVDVHQRDGSQVEQLTYGDDTAGNRVSALDQVVTTAGSRTSQTLTEYLNDSNNQTG